MSAVVLAGMLSLMVGLIEIGLGLGKLGFVADLLSSEVQVGYLNGLAVTIIVGQLPKLFGYSAGGDDFFADVQGFVENLDETVWQALAIGVGVLRRAARAPPLHPPTAGGARGRGRAPPSPRRRSTWRPRASTPSACSPRASPARRCRGPRSATSGPLLLGAVGITLVSLTDTIATASSFAARRGDEVDPNQEMVAMGASNIATGLFQGFAVSTSASRTAVAEQAGAKSQLTGVVGRRHRGRAPPLPERPARRPAPGRARRRGDRRGALAARPRGAAALLGRAPQRPAPLAHRHASA